MKRTALPLFAVALVAFAFLAGCGKDTGLKETAPEVKLYSIPNARITYTYSGDAKGTKVISFANYGMYESDSDDFSFAMNGQNTPIKTLTLRCDTVNYTVDLTKKVAQKSPFDWKGLKELTASFTPEQKDNVGGEMIQRMMGGKKAGKETILGKECEAYELPGGGKICMWKGIVMKQDMPMGGIKFTLVATKFEEDVDLAIADFTPAQDIKIEEPTAAPGMPSGHPPVDGGK